ncbi:hypothetical protein [Salinicola aestuarinus]|uniref:hypothetical protein n=1 Tax=Salinicola aestuarinus TaxID=1949082 RepID=UPI0013004EFB|nr:hypothetical protein [Salinicola aestuarinus]
MEIMYDSKRIAVCLSGHPRTFNETAVEFEKLFGSRVDFYFSTWSHPEAFGLEKIFSENGLRLVGYEYVAEPDYSRSERLILEKFCDTYPDFFIFNQWFGVKRAIQLMANYEEVIGRKYDIVFRARFDLSFDTSIESIFKKSDQESINYLEAVSKGSDQFMFSTRDNMMIFTKFEEWLQNYPNKYGAKYGFYASPLVKAFALDSGFSINKIDEKMTVVRDKPGSARLRREQRSKDYIAAKFPDLSGRVWTGDRAVKGLASPAPWDQGYYANPEALFLLNGLRSK